MENTNNMNDTNNIGELSALFNKLAEIKCALLQQILESTEKQADFLGAETPDFESFESLLDKRQALINEVDRMDGEIAQCGQLLSRLSPDLYRERSTAAYAAARAWLEQIIALDDKNQERLNKQKEQTGKNIAQQKTYVKNIGRYLEPYASGSSYFDEKK